MDDYKLEPPFVGRSRELEEVGRLLRDGRLVTVMGAGGAGKTRLALEAASQIAARFTAGLFTCELAPIADPTLVEAAVGAALGLPPEARGDLGTLTRQHLGEDTALLVVDNCEHVRAQVASTLRIIIKSAPGLRVLATSRERLRVAGETAWMLPSLSPDDALELLVRRAAALDATFQVGPDNRAALAEICARLEGLPLALELVAPRLVLLPAAQVAQMLDDALGVLSGSEGPARHRTMRAALDWSVALLRPSARDDLWRLAVFPSSFTLDAAATVFDAPALEALDRLAALRDTSLLVADTAAATARFRLLEPVRQYAIEHLAGAPDENDVRRRHALHVLRSAEWIGARLLGTPEQGSALTAFVELLPDLRQAVAWALEAEPAWAARIVGHTGWAWEITSRLREGEALERITLDVATDMADRARLLTRLLSLVNRRGGTDENAIAAAAIAAARAAGNPRELGMVLGLGLNGLTPEGASAQLDEVAAIAADTGDLLLHGWERFFRSHMSGEAGDWAGARAYMEAATADARALGDPWFTVVGTENIVNACLELGDNQSARRHLRSMLPTLIGHPDWASAPVLLGHTSRLASRTGRPADALRLLAVHRRLNEEIGARQWHRDTAEIEQVAGAELRGRSDVRKYLSEGARMSLADTLTLARAVVEEPAQRPDRRLSRRELEIVGLIGGAGLSNRDIADKLHLSVRTVEDHVGHVLGKLDLQSRVQIATWAAEHSLLE
ncbi:MAG TPA: LuxR C-terminal-related transcriptional regulator [Candidatus Angelobacter sp.]|nr:LuxR C-terminal-related transcriptional regulator [Candidatus Angelobacter sp.]